jgi:hypothetical protein
MRSTPLLLRTVKWRGRVVIPVVERVLKKRMAMMMRRKWETVKMRRKRRKEWQMMSHLLCLKETRLKVMEHLLLLVPILPNQLKVS